MVKASRDHFYLRQKRWATLEDKDKLIACPINIVEKTIQETEVSA